MKYYYHILCPISCTFFLSFKIDGRVIVILRYEVAIQHHGHCHFSMIMLHVVQADFANFSMASKERDLGLSKGKPSALAQTSCVIQPRARETPNITV